MARDSHDEIRVLREELARMRARLDALEEGSMQRQEPESRVSRANLLRGAGAAALGIAAASVLGGEPALADNGSNVVAGQNTTATNVTGISGSVLGDAALRASNFYTGPFDDYSDAFQAYTFGAGLAGVYGRNDAGGGSGVMGYSGNGVGGSFNGGMAPIRLQPASTAGAPTTLNHQQGEVYVDSAGTVWVCTQSGSSTTVGTFEQLATESGGGPSLSGAVLRHPGSLSWPGASYSFLDMQFASADLMHDSSPAYWSSAHPGRLTAPATGLYLVTAHIYYAPSAMSGYGCGVLDSSGSVWASDTATNGQSNEYWSLAVAALCWLQGGDYVRVCYYNEDNQPVNGVGASAGIARLA